MLFVVDGDGFSSHSEGIKTWGKEGNLIKLGKVSSDASDVKRKSSGGSADAEDSNPLEHPRVVFRRRSIQGSVAASDPTPIIRTYRREKPPLVKQMEVKQYIQSESNSDRSTIPDSQPPAKESKPLLKLKFKHINSDSQPPQLLCSEEKSSIKGQRSKRKRPTSFIGKTLMDGEGGNLLHEDNLSDEIMDANWILKKLGEDAIGKRVEVHRQSDNSWYVFLLPLSHYSRYSYGDGNLC